jgi:uncharacterized protein
MAGHRIVHFEIPADDPEALGKFYTDLFAWKVEKVPIPGFDYWMCQTGDGPGINGAITRRGAPINAVTNYVTVPQIDVMVERAKSLGTRVLVPKTAVAGVGWFCLAQDPQGNPLGFWQDDKEAR